MTISDTPGEDPHTVLHIYEGDGALVVRECGNMTVYGTQHPRLMAAFASDTAGPSDHAGLVARLRDLAALIDPLLLRGPDARLLNEAAEAIAALSRAPEAVGPWRCAECGCMSYSRVDVSADGRSFRPGPQVRCEGCKTVSTYPPTPPAPQPALALIEELTAELVEARTVIIAWASTSYGEPEKLKSIARIDTALASAKRFKGE